MTALRPRRLEAADHSRADVCSLTEDYEGLAWYLAQAIARGDANFDKASAELHATETEQASLRRAAAAAAKRERGGSLVARLLRTAEARHASLASGDRA